VNLVGELRGVAEDSLERVDDGKIGEAGRHVRDSGNLRNSAKRGKGELWTWETETRRHSFSTHSVTENDLVPLLSRDFSRLNVLELEPPSGRLSRDSIHRDDLLSESGRRVDKQSEKKVSESEISRRSTKSTHLTDPALSLTYFS